MLQGGRLLPSKTPLDYRYIFNFKNEGQERKIFSGGGWAQGKGEWWMYFVSIYENRIMKHVEIVLRREKEGKNR
jgi:hypothetical protein